MKFKKYFFTGLIIILIIIIMVLLGENFTYNKVDLQNGILF